MNPMTNIKTVILVEKRPSHSAGSVRETNMLIAALEEQGVKVDVFGSMRPEDVAALDLPEAGNSLCIVGLEAPNRHDTDHPSVQLANELVERGVHFKVLGDVDALNRNKGLTVGVVNFAGESYEDLTHFVKTHGAGELFNASVQANTRMQADLREVCVIEKCTRPLAPRTNNNGQPVTQSVPRVRTSLRPEVRG